jgi:hypothetical protein
VRLTGGFCNLRLENCVGSAALFFAGSQSRLFGNFPRAAEELLSIQLDAPPEEIDTRISFARGESPVSRGGIALSGLILT